VPNNYNVCLAVLHRVAANLHKDGLYDDYAAVIQQHLDEQILEVVPLEELDVENHVFVPHRPVVRNDSLTTKVRVVLNCSMKVGNAPSLNEAAYPGVDLVNNLLQLLLRVRADKYLVVRYTQSVPHDKIRLCFGPKQIYNFVEE